VRAVPLKTWAEFEAHLPRPIRWSVREFAVPGNADRMPRRLQPPHYTLRKDAPSEFRLKQPNLRRQPWLSFHTERRTFVVRWTGTPTYLFARRVGRIDARRQPAAETFF